ncbi:MAG: class I SAM-dependent methyltransferase [Calditrichaeota bacterium]|nr:MAG: class I SAM-dependent methyltransferase [Calditrichota bacterium]
MKVEEAYNLWAKTYDSDSNKTRDLDKIVTRISLTNLEDKNILELGCGTGKNTEFLVENSKSVFAMDFSEKMLKVAKEKVKAENVTFKVQDLTKNWELQNETFDIVLGNLVLEHIENLKPIFQESFRVLKSNGILFLCELHPFKQIGGSKAKFSEEEIRINSFIHDISEFISAGLEVGFELVECKEWRKNKNSPLEETPRLISFKFSKKVIT